MLLLLARAPRHRTRPHPHPTGNTSTLTRHSSITNPPSPGHRSFDFRDYARQPSSHPGETTILSLASVGVILTVALDWVRIMSLVNLANRQQRLENQVSRQLKHYQTPLYH